MNFEGPLLFGSGQAKRSVGSSLQREPFEDVWGSGEELRVDQVATT